MTVPLKGVRSEQRKPSSVRGSLLVLLTITEVYSLLSTGLARARLETNQPTHGGLPGGTSRLVPLPPVQLSLRSLVLPADPGESRGSRRWTSRCGADDVG